MANTRQFNCDIYSLVWLWHILTSLIVTYSYEPDCGIVSVWLWHIQSSMFVTYMYQVLNMNLTVKYFMRLLFILIIMIVIHTHAFDCDVFFRVWLWHIHILIWICLWHKLTSLLILFLQAAQYFIRCEKSERKLLTVGNLSLKNQGTWHAHVNRMVAKISLYIVLMTIWSILAGLWVN